MATDLERLVVSLEANIKKYEREMERSRAVTERAMRDVERSVTKSTAKIEGRMAAAGAAIKGGLVAALAGISLGKLTELSDSYTKVQNSLKVTGLEGDKLSATYQRLFDLAQKQGIPLESLSELYSKAATNQKELNASSADLIGFTNAVATSLRAGSVGAVDASNALGQLGQALGSGTVQWEELGNIVDTAPTILQAAAAGIKEAGGSVGTLTQLVKDGKVSSEALFRGIQAGLPAMDALARKTEDTSKQGITRLENALIDLAGEFLKSTGATSTAITALNNVAGSIKRLTDQIPGAIEALDSYFTKLSKAPYFQSLVKSIADTEGGNTPAEAAAPFNKPAPPSSSSDAIDRAKRERGPVEGADAKPKIDPISIEKYKPPGKKKGGGGGKGGDAAKSDNEYQSEIKSIRERTAALEQEATTVGQSEGAIAKAETAFKLLEAAKKANVAITPILKADIEAVASAMGVATQKLEEAEEANRKFGAASKQFGSTLSDGFKDAILEGEKLTVVMDRLIKSLASKGIDSVFDSLFSKAGAGTGLLGSLFGGGGLNPTGRAAGGPVKVGSAYTVGESGRETFVPTSPGRIIPAGRGRGGGPSVSIGGTVINAPGADAQALAQLRGYVDAGRREDRRLIGQSLATWKENN